MLCGLSFRLAAVELGVTALSYRLKQLEDRFNIASSIARQAAARQHRRPKVSEPPQTPGTNMRVLGYNVLLAALRASRCPKYRLKRRRM